MSRKTAYKKEYCDLLLEQMGKGRSVVRFCAAVGISRDTFYEWTRRYKAFNDAFKRGKELAESYWETIGERAMLGMPIDDNNPKVKVNTGLYFFYMRNRFSWKDGLEKETAPPPVEKPSQTIDIKNLIVVNANKSPEERARIISQLERFEYADK